MSGTTVSTAGGPQCPAGPVLAGRPREDLGPDRGPSAKQPVSRDAQRVAAAILEVLAGVRTPTEAAAAWASRCPGITSGSSGPWRAWCGPASRGPWARQPASGIRSPCWRRKSPACGRTVPGSRPWCGPRSGRSAWQGLRSSPPSRRPSPAARRQPRRLARPPARRSASGARWPGP